MEVIQCENLCVTFFWGGGSEFEYLILVFHKVFFWWGDVIIYIWNMWPLQVYINL